MLKSKKHVFWEALLITVVVFLIGLFVGMMVEAGNSAKISNLYTQSEISLVDGMALVQLSDNQDNCDLLKEANINFANKVYNEAKLLEDYEESGKLTEGMDLLHQKYDLLRTLLWMANTDSLENCNNYNLIVYLYEYETEDLEKKATQVVWSKILQDVRENNQDILLIPIATDQDLTSLDILLEDYGISQVPALVINNEAKVYELSDANQVEALLN